MDGAFIVCIPMPGPVPTAGKQKPQEHQDACTCRSQADRKINGRQRLQLRAAGLRRGGLAAWGQESTPPCAQDQKIRGWPVDVGRGVQREECDEGQEWREETAWEEWRQICGREGKVEGLRWSSVVLCAGAHRQNLCTTLSPDPFQRGLNTRRAVSRGLQLLLPCPPCQAHTQDGVRPR